VTRDTGEGNVIIIAMNGANGKLVAFGSVYAPRSVDCEDDSGPSIDLVNTGNFVLFER
jgi:hypothetical protein